jgi:hypothetical protein
MPALLARPADDSVKEPHRFTQQRPSTFYFSRRHWLFETRRAGAIPQGWRLPKLGDTVEKVFSG